MTTKSEHDRVTTRVVDALAAAAGTDPIDLYPPLYYSVDTDALERLFHGSGPVRLQFEHDDRTVVVEADGTITIDGTVYGESASEDHA